MHRRPPCLVHVCVFFCCPEPGGRPTAPTPVRRLGPGLPGNLAFAILTYILRLLYIFEDASSLHLFGHTCGQHPAERPGHWRMQE